MKDYTKPPTEEFEFLSKLKWKHEYTFETMLDEMIEYWLNKYN